MKQGVWLWLAAAIILPSVATGQTKPATTSADAPPPIAGPAPNARIVTHDSASKGPLQISYSDGATVEIPMERGRFDVTQAGFSQIQVAVDRQHIGWLAEYSICAQSYPCPAELVIYRAGHARVTISPPHGIAWKWTFLANGKQVALQFGFPHGDAVGQYALHDSDSGRQVAVFSPGKTTVPDWVRFLQSQHK